ncbi:serine proteinase stubble-like [Uloborus diversus]|uniref:serine proteinase stubble-like n=1 Tax=Uloborus diversus TaxID=327109 RepID=UPI002409CC6F|nr:serine proteinase stubble-like [Uloborus diversus]
MNYQKKLTACTLISYIVISILVTGKNASSIQIRPESCTNAMGDKGTCMFVWQCIKQDGTQLGPCVDRFLVGTCCQLPKEEDNMVLGSSDNSSTSKPYFPTKGNVFTKPKPTTVPTRPSEATTPQLTIGTSSLVIAPVTLPPVPKPLASSLISQAATPQIVVATTKKPNLDDYSECGVQSPYPKSKVVGGTHSAFGEWPWQVSVRRSTFFGFTSTHRCGGAILNANWIATAGHCVDDLQKPQIRIRVGEYDFNTVDEPAAFQERGVLRKIVHPRYNFFTYEYDLALVKLDSPLVLKPHVRPICLPTKDETYIGYNATVTGWGRLSEGGSLPTKLQQVTVPIISNDKCQKMFKKAGRHELIPSIFLCAGYEAGGRDSCQGDSGGPLQTKREDGRWFLVGIISWGIGCAEPNMPGVCTRISKFTDWITQTIS